jgi:hypothetical protein
MVSSHSVIARSSEFPCFRMLTLLCRARLLARYSWSRSVRAVRPASQAVSARHLVCHQSPVKIGAPRRQAWAIHPSENAGFGHAGLALQSSGSENFMRLPVSQRLKPQLSMPARFCTHPFASAAQRVCRSLSTQGRRASVRISSAKQERVGSHQPPNPSFKRTCLRHAA